MKHREEKDSAIEDRSSVISKVTISSLTYIVYN